MTRIREEEEEDRGVVRTTTQVRRQDQGLISTTSKVLNQFRREFVRVISGCRLPRKISLRSEHGYSPNTRSWSSQYVLHYFSSFFQLSLQPRQLHRFTCRIHRKPWFRAWKHLLGILNRTFDIWTLLPKRPFWARFRRVST